MAASISRASFSKISLTSLFAAVFAARFICAALALSASDTVSFGSSTLVAMMAPLM